MSIFYLEKVSKIFKTHNGNFFALKNINLVFDKVGLVSIVGKSGSGKSTLLNILLGIEKPSSGIIKFKSKTITKMSDRAFSKYHLNDVSMIFQHYNIFEELTAKENIALPLLIKGEKKRRIDKAVNNLLDRFSIKYLANQKTKFLSGGEKQRVAILRALITSPSVILCDEPTGALDSENSLAIMDMLKELSKDILVIHVSHNKELVDKYSDRIVRLKDGEVIEDKIINQCESKVFEKKKYRYSSNWSYLFTKKNLTLNIKKNIFSIFSSVFGFSAILLCFGFYNGSQTSQANALKSNLSVMHASSSMKTFFEIENSPLSYEKSVRPSLFNLESNLSDFKDIYFEPNLSFLFPAYPYGSYQNKPIENFQLVPLYDVSLETYGKDLLVSGTPADEKIEEVIVNEEFTKLLGKSNDEIVDDLFSISYSSTISFPTGDYQNPTIKDEFSFHYDLTIKGVVKEFPFLNSPKIYYSYKALKKELDTLYLKNISDYLDDPTTYLRYIEDANDDDIVSSYSYEIFLGSIAEVDHLFNKIKLFSENESTFQIDSPAYDIQQSYKTFIESFSSALFVFVIIAFIGVNFILGMISLSTFIENKKNSAILTCLGARNESIQSIYLAENYLMISLAVVPSLLISIFVQKVLNNLIAAKFALFDLITIPLKSFYGIPYGLVIGLVIVAFIFSTIFTLVPMFIYRKISLTDELRDE